MMKVFNDKGTVRVTLDGEVGQGWFGEGIGLDSVRSLVTPETEALEIDLRTMGGDTFEAFAMYDYLRSLSVPTKVNIVGATASAGTLIAMGADERTITQNSKFLVHNNWTVTQGDSEEHQKAAEALARFDRDIVNIYHKATGMNKAALRSLMKEERWMDAAEAKEKGFVNRIINFKNQVMENEKIDQLTEQVKTMQATIDGLHADLLGKDAIIKDFENKRIEAAIVALEKDGKVTAENKTSVHAMLIKDFDGTMAVLNSIRIAPAFDPDQYMKDGQQSKTWDNYTMLELKQLEQRSPAVYNKLLADKRKQIKG
jgi:ATP-dependent protease ClpP protease subunit